MPHKKVVDIKLSTALIQTQRAFRKGRPDYPLIIMATSEPAVSVVSVDLATA